MICLPVLLATTASAVTKEVADQGFIKLSAFNWVSILFVTGILVSIVGFLATLMIKWFKADMQKMDKRIEDEAAERKQSDMQLAEALQKVTECLNSFKVSSINEHSRFATRDEVQQNFGKVDSKMDKFHSRLDDIYKKINEGFVTKDECKAKCKG